MIPTPSNDTRGLAPPPLLSASPKQSTNAMGHGSSPAPPTTTKQLETRGFPPPPPPKPPRAPSAAAFHSSPPSSPTLSTKNFHNPPSHSPIHKPRSGSNVPPIPAARTHTNDPSSSRRGSGGGGGLVAEPSGSNTGLSDSEKRSSLERKLEICVTRLFGFYSP